MMHGHEKSRSALALSAMEQWSLSLSSHPRTSGRKGGQHPHAETRYTPIYWCSGRGPSRRNALGPGSFPDSWAVGFEEADPCSALDCETTNGSGSKIFCPGSPAFEAAGRTEHLRNSVPAPAAPAPQTPSLNPIPGPLPPPQQPRNSCLTSQGTWSAS
jgi:hypothetical protein